MRALILTEDGAKAAHDVIRGILFAIFKLLVTQTPHTHRIQCLPVSEAERRLMLANQWKDKSRADLVDLRARIAGELARGGFVFFHCDGDTRWSTRHESPNRAPFDRLIRAGVRNALAQNRDPDEADRLLRRLHLVMPFYSIESWLYQNTVVALRLCREKGLASDEAQFMAWEADRTLLDEVWQPKKATRLGDHGNAELARGFPADAVYDVSPSFTAVVADLLADADLIAALEATVVT